MKRSTMLALATAFSLAGCAGQWQYTDGPNDPPQAGDLVQDTASAIRIAQGACLLRFADPTQAKNDWAANPPLWHARLQRKYWSVWVPEPLAPDHVNMKVHIRAKDGRASLCEMWAIEA